jgi:hypothetical protein
MLLLLSQNREAMLQEKGSAAFMTSSASLRRRTRWLCNSSSRFSASHFSAFFFAVQLVAGLLLLSGYFVPLALVLLAAEIFNILAIHLTMALATIGPGILAAVLRVLVFLQHRPSFDGIMSAKQFNQLDTK